METTYIDKFSIKREINNFFIYFNVFDTPCWNGRYSTVVEKYIPGSNGIILLFALNERKSFLALDYCYKLIIDNDIDLSKVPILLLGTKADLTDQIEIKYEEALEYSRKKNFVGYFEISSDSGYNVEKAIDFMAKCILLINNFNKSMNDIKFI